MGHAVGFLKLVKLLNLANDLSLKKDVIRTALDLTDEQLHDVCGKLELLGIKIKVSGDSISLPHKVDLLDDASIFKRVSGAGRIEILESVDSTNTYMLKNARFLASGDTVIAECQEAGRGRRGSRWHSSFGKQLTMSLCYIFDDFCKLEGLSVGIGVAVAKSVEHFGFEDILLKWPNDIYKDHKKFGGILIETVPYKNKIKAIIGVGLNVYADEFTNIDSEYTSIFESKPDGFKRNDLAVQLINNIKKVCQDFNLNNKKMTIESFKARDELLGRNIRVENEQGSFEGKAAGVDLHGSLLLASEKDVISIRSGHITNLQ